jgi:cell division protein FtsX
VISALVSTAAVYGAYTLVENKVEAMSVSLIPFTSVVWYLLAMFLVLGSVTGCLGSIVSIGKYLRKEGSEFRAF